MFGVQHQKAFFSCVLTESLHKYSIKKTLYNRIDMGRKQQLIVGIGQAPTIDDQLCVCLTESPQM